MKPDHLLHSPGMRWMMLLAFTLAAFEPNTPERLVALDLATRHLDFIA